MRTSKVYPFRLYEKVLAAFIPLLVIAPFVLPRSPITVGPTPDSRWRICVEIGWIPSWYHCWEVGGPKQLAPDVPAGCCSDTCVGPCQ